MVDMALLEQVQEVGNALFQILAVNDKVDETIFKELLRALETIGEFLDFQGFFHHAWTSKTDEGFGLREVQVAQHRVRGRYATRGRVGQEREVRDLSFRQSG